MAKQSEPIGSGRRFRDLSAKLAAKGARSPDGLAAYLGRKKYGEQRFAALAADGRARAKDGKARRVKL